MRLKMRLNSWGPFFFFVIVRQNNNKKNYVCVCCLFWLWILLFRSWSGTRSDWLTFELAQPITGQLGKQQQKKVETSHTEARPESAATIMHRICTLTKDAVCCTSKHTIIHSSSLTAQLTCSERQLMLYNKKCGSYTWSRFIQTRTQLFKNSDLRASLLLLHSSCDQTQYCFFIVAVVALLILDRVHHLHLEHRERRGM